MPVLEWSEMSEELTNLKHFTPEERMQIINSVYEDYERLSLLLKDNGSFLPNSDSEFDKNILLLYKKVLGLLIKKHGH